jgi:surface antigen
MGTSRLAATLAVLSSFALLPAPASAALWTSTPPGPWSCTSAGNACVAHTGFNPNQSYWGQATNPRGNCTNYVAYRLIKNGASKPAGLSGGAAAWAGKVRAALGASHVNSTPAVGSIAWWGGGAGHVAYVEKVAGGSVYLSDSSFPLGSFGGSERYVVKRGDRRWPDAFLHIKDQPAQPAPAAEPETSEEAPPPPHSSPAPAPAQHVYHVHNTCADSSCGLLVETAPGSHYGGKVIGSLPDGTAVNIRCQAVGGMITGGEGSNDVWDQIDYKGGIGYVADLYVDTPGDVKAGTHRYFTSSIPRC